MIETGFLDEGQQVIENRLGLSRKTDDDGGSQGRIADGAPDVPDGFSDFVFGRTSVHRLQYPVVDMLDGHIDVRTYLVLVADGLQEVCRDAAGVGVKQPDPAYLFYGGEVSEQPAQGRFRLEVAAVRG
ncbi:MAG: hypothetical protein CSYNP_04393 [Syntrophus sp. SKADARSKE-3]|nr:hypothetical protein [Syntrophus sp. SKADARSKE-3]